MCVVFYQFPKQARQAWVLLFLGVCKRLLELWCLCLWTIGYGYCFARGVNTQVPNLGMSWSHFCRSLLPPVSLIGPTNKSQIWGKTNGLPPAATLEQRGDEVIFVNEPMVTLISVCMLILCAVGDQPTRPKCGVW